ncbi:MAG: FeoB-associated Cys-rich membrane protein [Eubacterium sp.]|nr:FeoB-associated Cys-rich membrane protein [Eubacterium sp.]
MNAQSIIILAVIAIAVISAVIVYRKKGNSCSCGGNCENCSLDCSKK